MTEFPLSLINEKIVDHYFTIRSHMVIHDCTFDGCIVDWPEGVHHVKLMYTTFQSCAIAGDGWPPNIMEIIFKS